MCITLAVTLIICTLFAHPKLIRGVIHPQNIIPFAHPATNQRRPNEFRKESIYIPVRPCYNIHRWTKTMLFRCGQKGVIHRETSRIRDTNLQQFPRKKIK